MSTGMHSANVPLLGGEETDEGYATIMSDVEAAATMKERTEGPRRRSGKGRNTRQTLPGGVRRVKAQEFESLDFEDGARARRGSRTRPPRACGVRARRAAA